MDNVDIHMANRIVKILNDMVEKDKQSIASLMSIRVPCNSEIENHPTIVVQNMHGGTQVGILGILNGITGKYQNGPNVGKGPIAAVYDDKGNLQEFVIPK